MITDDDLYLMARDYEAMDRKAAQDAEELRQFRAGERIVVPVDIDHARTMFKLACYYLKQHDPKFELELA